MRPADDEQRAHGTPTGLANREKWAAFDPFADEWADLIRAIRDRLITTADVAAGQRVLDAGAGVG